MKAFQAILQVGAAGNDRCRLTGKEAVDGCYVRMDEGVVFLSWTALKNYVVMRTEMGNSKEENDQK